MDWIKVTQETMPPDMESVFASVIDEDGDKVLYPECRWNSWRKIWEYPKEWYGWDEVVWLRVIGTVTHWMPYPDPAED